MLHDTRFAQVEGAKGGGGGKGGGKGGGGGASSGQEAPNTLQSKARARVAELISEGECEGLVGGAKGVFFDETPLQNTDGSFNFEGVTLDQRYGTPDQAHVTGMPVVEEPHGVEQQVKASIGPVTRTIIDENADRVRFIMRIPQLAQYDDKGNINGSNLSYTIEIQPSGGDWYVGHVQSLQNEKCTSSVNLQHVVPLNGTGPWNARVTRNTADSTDSKTANDLYWDSYTTITDGKFTYPNSAYIYFEIDAERFGSSLPARAYRYRGLKVQVPTNYNPIARTYSGVWDGRFKIAWTNNPAWVFYDLVTNDRYGLGEFVDVQRVDKWTLYQIGRYCDEQVPSGFKDQSGNKLYEPRFSFNGVINSREEAAAVLTNITSSFRGMAFWSLGQVYAVADMPADEDVLVTPANVIGGRFKYSGTAKKARHSVAMVSYSDQTDFGRAAVEVVINQQMLVEYGWRDTSVVKHGCTSRGEAHRFGKWILDTEQNENETVEYTAGWDHAKLKPFQIVQIADPNKALWRGGGRVVSVAADLQRVTLDAPVDLIGTNQYWLSVTMPDGTLQKHKIVAFSNGNATVQLEGALTSKPVDGAVFIVTATSVNPRKFRILSIKETDEGLYQVIALFHDPNKYARVERDIVLEDIPYVRPPATTPKPLAHDLRELQYVEEGVAISKIMLSWTPGSPYAVRHMVVVSGPKGRQSYSNLTSPILEIFGVIAGRYDIQIISFGITGIPSKPYEIAYDAHGWGGTAAPRIENLRLTSGTGTEFVSADCEITWDNVLAGGPAFYDRNLVEVYNTQTGALLRSEVVKVPSYSYTIDRNVADADALGSSPARFLRFEVTLIDINERSSPEVALSVSNPQPLTPAPQLTPGFSQIFIDWADPVDQDYKGTLVWVKNTTFDPRFAEPTYDVKGGPIGIPAPGGQAQYVAIACYDAFGKADLNYSAVGKVTPFVNTVDLDPPAKPTGLKAESVIAADGMARIIFSWDKQNEEDLAGYLLEVCTVLNGLGERSNWVGQSTSYLEAEFTIAPGSTVIARLSSFDKSLNYSNPTDELTYQVASDTVAPPKPTGLKATGIFRSVAVVWDAVAVRDLAYYELRATYADGSQEMFRVYSERSTHTNVERDQTILYEVRAVDTSYNVSDWSDPDEATVGKIEGEDIPPDAIVSSMALIDQAFIEGAWIVELDASKIRAGSILSPEVIVDGRALGSLATTTTYLNDIMEQDWSRAAGTGTGAYSTDPADIRVGTRSLSIAKGAVSQWYSPQLVALDPDKLYRVAFRVRRKGALGATPGNFFMGVNGVALDKKTFVNRTGANSPADAFYCVANGRSQATIPETWTEIVGYVKGSIAAPQSPEGTLKSPAPLHINARYFRPFIQVNHPGGTGDWGANIIVDSVKIDALTEEAAAIVNAGSTKIEPGSISVNGPNVAGSITDWRAPNKTTINGGSIETGTIGAEQLTVGRRGVLTEGIVFEANKPFVNHVFYTGGRIRYTGDDGNIAFRDIPSSENNFVFFNGSSPKWIYWAKGENVLRNTDNVAVAFDPNNVILAYYRGGLDLDVNFGRTVIDGSGIKTGTIQAEQLDVNAVQSKHIAALAIEAKHLSAGAVSAETMAIQQRGISLVGIKFDPNSGINGPDNVSWTAGNITYLDDDKVVKTVNIAAGFAWVGTTGRKYIYWVKGETSFRNNADYRQAYKTGQVVVGVYDGGMKFASDFGTTTIDGSGIKTNAVTADKIDVTNLSALNIKVQNADIQNLTLGGEKFAYNTLSTLYSGSWSGGVGQGFNVPVSRSVSMGPNEKLLITVNASLFGSTNFETETIWLGYLQIWIGGTQLASVPLIGASVEYSASWTASLSATYDAGGAGGGGTVQAVLNLGSGGQRDQGSYQQGAVNSGVVDFISLDILKVRR